MTELAALEVPQRKKPTGWRELVVARATYLDAQLRAIPGVEEALPVARAVQAHLHAAVKAATLHPWGWARFRDWWTGALVDAAWLNLHNAELLLISLQSEHELSASREAVMALVEKTLTPKDRRRADAKRRLCDEWRPDTKVGDAERAAYRAALNWAFVASDEQYTRVRSLRNLIHTTTLGLFVLVALLAALGFWQPALLDLCFEGQCPTSQGQPNGPDVALVLGLGLLGGALAAMVAIRGIRGTSTPYGVPVALALLKLPAGALVSLVGLLLIAGGFLPGLSALDSSQQIVGYAVVLGYAQQLVTRLVDKQAQDVLGRVPSSEPMTPPRDSKEEDQWPAPEPATERPRTSDPVPTTL
ncbi:hypothetical protein WEI85_28145 [Actinomycetes bacterium KLBMP 9797]